MKHRFWRVLALVLASALVMSSASMALTRQDAADDSGDSGDSGRVVMALSRAAVTITSAAQLTPYFPDAAFREAVFNAVKNGTGNAIGANIEEALHNFEGTVKAVRKGISDIRGLQLLRHAEKVDLSHNRIRDFTKLSASGSFSDDYYGFVHPVDGNRNVTWDFKGNPIELLPENFGGWLVIEQPATASYTYDDLPTQLFLRDTARQTFSTEVYLGRCRILGSSEDNNKIKDGYVKMTTQGAFLRPGHSIGTVLGYNNPTLTTDYTMKVGEILHSGKIMVAVPMEKVVHYETTDEFGTLTPGSESFKYYISQAVEVYDRITVTHEGYTGGFTFTKTDENNRPLAGVEFELYYGATLLGGNITTGADGTITRQGLDAGVYTLRETKAPAGYAIGEDVHITVAAEVPVLVMSGGERRVTPTNAASQTATESMTFIKNADTPAIAMAFRDGVDHTDVHGSIAITYSSLLGGAGKTSRFPQSDTTIADAVAELNGHIAAGDITGPVTVAVKYEGASVNLPTMHVMATAANQPLPSPKEVRVEKTWSDVISDPADMPDSVTFELLRDGQRIDTLTLTAAGGWKDSFGSLPAADGHGKLYTYTVKEEPLLNFRAGEPVRVESGASLVFQVENRSLLEPPEHEPGDPVEPDEPTPPPPPPPPSSDDDDGDPGDPPVFFPPTPPPTPPIPPIVEEVKPKEEEKPTAKENPKTGVHVPYYADLTLALAGALAALALLSRRK